MKVSLISQIAEVQREIEQRRKVYGRLVAKGQKRQSEADYQIGLMKAVAESLLWLQRNETVVKAAVRRNEGGDE